MHNNFDIQCPGCLARFSKYPGFYKPLQDWFFSMRVKDSRFHCADAGRGKIDQEAYFARGASNAHFGESAHNFNVAVDTFFQVDGNYCLDSALYLSLVAGLAPEINWYGIPGSPFKEIPHFEWGSWRTLRTTGVVTLVEPL